MRGMARVEVAVLGPLQLRVDGIPLRIPGPKQRALVAVLAAHVNHVVSTSTLVSALWDDAAPDGADHTLQQHISTIRKQLDAAGVEQPAASVLVTQRPGYTLRVERVDVDDWDRASLAGLEALSAKQWSAAIAAFDEGLALWRGDAFEDVHDGRSLHAAAVRLEEQRLNVYEARGTALVADGRERELVTEHERLVDLHPLRERFWWQLMLALYRSGRQADALAAYAKARSALVEGLGLEPGADLRDLETAILQHSPSLDRAHSAVDPDLSATFQAGSGAELGRIVLPDGQVVLLQPGVSTIGRDANALVRLVDNRVSRSHAAVEATDHGCTLRDLGSSNGTTVNGEPGVEWRLADGDVIGIGGVALVFHQPG